MLKNLHLKKVAALVLTAVVAVGVGTGVSGVKASAATEEKTATYNSQLVSFNDAAAVTVPCYNIDGYNYYRARDIAKPLNLRLDGYTTEVMGTPAGSISLKDNYPYEDAVSTAPSTTPSVSVTLNDVNIFWDGIPLNDSSNGFKYDLKSFNVGGYNYYKIADIAAASQNSVSVQQLAQEVTNRPPVDTNLKSLTATFDSGTKVTNIAVTDNDMVAYWNQVHGDTAASQPTATSVPVATQKPATPEPMPEETAEPQELEQTTDMPTEVEVEQKLAELEQMYPTGTPWGDDKGYDWVNGGCMGYGCTAFTAMASDYIFGDAPVRTIQGADVSVDNLRTCIQP